MNEHELYRMVVALHVMAVVLWMAAMCTVYWLMRVHGHAPKSASDQLTAMERGMALFMDIAATVAIGCGIWLAVKAHLFEGKRENSWLHVKLALVVLGVLPVHGMIRARLKKFSAGTISEMPQWLWSMWLVAVSGTIIVAVTKLGLMG